MSVTKFQYVLFLTKQTNICNMQVLCNKKIYSVVKMTPEERNKYYSPMINNYHGLVVWSNEHKKRYNELIEKRKNEAYIFINPKDNGIIVFSILDKGKKWSFCPKMQSLFDIDNIK